MKAKHRIFLIAAIVAAFGLGALSDPLVSSVAYELDARVNMERRNAAYFDGTTGLYAPTAVAYFIGRAQGFEEARELLLRANDNGTTDPHVLP